MKEEDTKRSRGRQFLLCLDVNENKSDDQEIARQIADLPNTFGHRFFSTRHGDKNGRSLGHYNTNCVCCK